MVISELAVWLVSDTVVWTPMFFLRGANITIDIVETTSTMAPSTHTVMNDLPGGSFLQSKFG